VTLRERILARLALAEAATPGPWTQGTNPSPGWDGDIVRFADGGYAVASTGAADAAFIADRSPDRVIAECRADLALLDALDEWDGIYPRLRSALTNLHNRYPEGESS
jgi:hypothetical protein